MSKKKNNLAMGKEFIINTSDIDDANDKQNISTGGLDQDDYETIIFEHDYQKDNILAAMNVVKQFIINKKRILTGGMAIDMALRKKGSFLYKDNKIPDYDFYSPEFHKDAYDLGSVLSNKFSDISVINAMHSSTMRVRVQFVVVADITYIPEEVYNNIPTIVYNNLIVVHPSYQMIDQHLALSFPFKNPPMETIMDRWKKDIMRYDLLTKSYPINFPDIKASKYSSLVNFAIKCKILKNNCIGGIVGLLYWLDLAKKEGLDLHYNTINKNKAGYQSIFKPLHLSVKELKVSIPVECSLSILSDTYEILMTEFKGDVKYYNELIDKIPRKITITNGKSTVEIIDNKGSLVSAHLCKEGIYISNLQYIMCYLLTQGIFYKNEISLYAYKIAQDILFWAAESYNKETSKKKQIYEKYLPTCETYGKYNKSSSYILLLNRELSFLRESFKSYSIPRPAYPSKDKIINQDLYNFDPSASDIYQIDGMETKEFYPLEF